MMEQVKDRAIVYHGGCPDGLGGAYAAWKKFGDTADYIPAKHQRPVPAGLEGKDLYFIDFCYPEDVMRTVAQAAKSVTVLDHHEGVRDTATKFPGVFDTTHSGAMIAWKYFHPDTEPPKLITYIEDGDLYKFSLPHSREILAYVYISPFIPNIEHWDALVNELEDSQEIERVIHTGSLFNQYHEHVIQDALKHAELVIFEDYECYLAGAFGEFISDTGHTLATTKPPIALIVSAGPNGLRISLRSDGSVDVSALARKYGGNGHHDAAGFLVPFGTHVPWKTVEKKDENPRD